MHPGENADPADAPKGYTGHGYTGIATRGRTPVITDPNLKGYTGYGYTGDSALGVQGEDITTAVFNAMSSILDDSDDISVSTDPGSQRISFSFAS